MKKTRHKLEYLIGECLEHVESIVYLGQKFHCLTRRRNRKKRRQSSAWLEYFQQIPKHIQIIGKHGRKEEALEYLCIT